MSEHKTSQLSVKYFHQNSTILGNTQHLGMMGLVHDDRSDVYSSTYPYQNYFSINNKIHRHSFMIWLFCVVRSSLGGLGGVAL